MTTLAGFVEQLPPDIQKEVKDFADKCIFLYVHVK